MNPITPTVSILEYEHAADAGRMLQHFCHGASKKRGRLQDIDGEFVEIGYDVFLAGKKVKTGGMSDSLPHRSAVEVELADAVIRIADLAGALGLDLGPTIAELLAFNASAQR